ncbi:AMP-binding protein [Acanthopleuribacter pedis]|uniref:AMP-binding protein n=1 Tax=Acanthopleuribacter pedis TaxID=442870 RepID=A0A8J7U3D4_9BACT|nr:AMP-binding protein [Acanthopleuribacter pedis]MBO1319517.1 AMP-binding protein [Acanthopleuribacter pedis]
MSTVTQVLHNSDQRRKHHDFWRQRLTRIEQPFHFQCVRQQQAADATGRFQFRFTLDTAVADLVEPQPDDNPVTPFVYHLAALHQVLGIYARQTCIIVDTPGFRFRPAGGHVSIIEKLNPRQSTVDFLAQVRQTLDDSYQYQDFELEEVEDEAFHLSGTTSPILLAYNRIHHTPKSTDYPLCIFLKREEGRTQWCLDAESSRFDAAFLEEFCRHWQHVLRQFEDPTLPCGRLSVLNENQQKRMLHFYGPVNHAPTAQTLISNWEQTCRKQPDHTALFSDGEKLTYAQLNQRANFLAATLWAEHAVNHGHRVAWYPDRSLTSAITLLGILKAGAIACPMDRDQEPDLAAARLEALDPHLTILADEAAAKNLSARGKQLHLHRLFWRDDIANLPILVKAADTALIVYSAQNEAFIPLTHAMLANSTRIQAEGFDLTPSDRVLLVDGPAAEMSPIELLTTWTAGAAGVLFDPALLQNQQRLHSFLTATGVTIAAFTPDVLAQLEPETLAHLRVIMTKGKARLAELAGRYAQSHHFFNVYGTPETGGWISFYHIYPEDICGDHLPVGKALGDFSVYILSDNLQLLPPGLIGEICISGSAVAQGYLHDGPHAHRFVEDPFRPGLRMVRTGDLGYRQEDGNLVYLGSMTEHVRVQGYRINSSTGDVPT